MRFWLFIFNDEEYLTWQAALELKFDYWKLDHRIVRCENQSSYKPEKGDMFHLWKTGSDGGLVGTGIVSEILKNDPKIEARIYSETKKYWKIKPIKKLTTPEFIKVAYDPIFSKSNLIENKIPNKEKLFSTILGYNPAFIAQIKTMNWQGTYFEITEDAYQFFAHKVLFLPTTLDQFVDKSISTSSKESTINQSKNLSVTNKQVNDRLKESLNDNKQKEKTMITNKSDKYKDQDIRHERNSKFTNDPNAFMSNLKSWNNSLPFPLSSILLDYINEPTIDYTIRLKRWVFFFESCSKFFCAIQMSLYFNGITLRPYIQGIIEIYLEKLELATVGTWTEYFSKFAKITNNLLQKNKRGITNICGDQSEEFWNRLSQPQLTNILNKANNYRNKYDGHTGVISPKIEIERINELNVLLKELMEYLGDIFNSIRFVQNINAEHDKGVYMNQVRNLMQPHARFELISMQTHDVMDKRFIYYNFPSNDPIQRIFSVIPLIIMESDAETRTQKCYYFSSAKKTELIYKGYYSEISQDIVKNKDEFSEMFNFFELYSNKKTPQNKSKEQKFESNLPEPNNLKNSSRVETYPRFFTHLQQEFRQKTGQDTVNFQPGYPNLLGIKGYREVEFCWRFSRDEGFGIDFMTKNRKLFDYLHKEFTTNNISNLEFIWRPSEKVEHHWFLASSWKIEITEITDDIKTNMIEWAIKTMQEILIIFKSMIDRFFIVK